MTFKFSSFSFLDYMLCMLLIQSAIIKAEYNEDEIDLILTSTQKERLDKFKQLMGPQLPQDYMKEDIYLVKWLKVNDFDIPSATRMLLDNIAWRKENRMDKILEEDWSDLNDEYKFVIEAAVAYVGDWDLRKLVIAGKGRRVMRYVDKLYEESNKILRNMQGGGSNSTRANLILEVSRFNVRQHFCPGCAPILGHLVSTLHRHFPLTVNFLIVLNTPQLALPIWDFVKPLMPKKSQEFVFIYGTNQNEWHKALWEKHRIDANKMSRALGGEGQDGLDFNTIADNNHYYQCPTTP
ncbi:SEC14-like protein 5 isoform X2 [Folsomia candida]|uniref:SEC14-like protein 5 isoform X2 n=1 Tax=Folsomia candida TaxID=158441 RepID=UPI000B8F67F8|nr:SEC14-like protein 5 isoform X2 [Folsomia candida]